MTRRRQKKGELERIADMILLDDAIEQGFVKNTGNKHGLGTYAAKYGLLHPSKESQITASEKTGFSPEQLEEIADHGLDVETRKRYN
jgi:hypothetical protein